MTVTISELMDNYRDSEYALFDPDADTARIRALTERKLAFLRRDAPVRRRARTPRIVWIGIAAALILGMSATAWAVYQVLIQDYAVKTPTLLDAVMEDIGMTPGPGVPISLVGYQGTPEYDAYTAWEAWQAEHYGDHPMDNSNRHETPDNYYEFYGAAWQEQADALDEIAARYGVRLHESMALADAEQIYQLLDAEPFISDGYENGSGYIYNDGTFDLDFNWDHGGVTDSGSIFVSVKGTITDISGGFDMDGGYEEWNYQTASGPVVDLVLSPLNAHIFYETGSAYIHVNAARMDHTGGMMSHTRGSLESLADSIDFGELSRVFDAGACFDLAGELEALDAANEQQDLAIGERLQREAEEDYSHSLEVVERLGVYGPDPLPEGYAAGPFAWAGLEQTVTAHGESYDGAMTPWGATVSEDCVARSYANAAGEGFHLSYARYYTDESRTASAAAEQFAAAQAYYAAFEGYRPCQVNGCPGFYFPVVQNADGIIYDPGVLWLDASHDLVFVLDMSVSYFDVQTKKTVFPGDPFTPAELIALAATVTAE